jgi:hypothetical protein
MRTMTTNQDAHDQMGVLEKKRILLSKTEYDDTGAEIVRATITNDWAKDAIGKPIFCKQYAYPHSSSNISSST